MTKNQALRRHRMLWRWLAKNPTKRKQDWPGWKENGGKHDLIKDNCFLCAVSDCPDCLVVWPGDSVGCSGSLFGDWERAKGRKRSNLAKKISELPRRR